MDKIDYYNRMFRAGRDKEWDKAPGKTVLVNAFKELGEDVGFGTVLDVGCGTGCLLSLIYDAVKKQGLKFFGIDISEAAINLAKGRYPAIRFRVEDGMDTSFKDESIGILTGYGVYEHFDNPEGGIKEIARILTPSGIFLLMIPALGHYRDDRNDEGWYEDKTGQPQWNFFRKTWEDFFNKYNLKLSSQEEALKYGAKNPGCFFFGRKI